MADEPDNLMPEQLRRIRAENAQTHDVLKSVVKQQAEMAQSLSGMLQILGFVNGRLDKIEVRLDRLDDRVERIQRRQDSMDGRLERIEKHLGLVHA